MANYNLTQTGDEVQAYIDSIPVIDVTGTLSGSTITFDSNPYSQIAANYAADCGSIVRLTVGTAVYLLRVTQYDGTNYTAAEMSGAHNVVATIGSSSASATIDAGIDDVPTQDSDNLVKSGGVWSDINEINNRFYKKNTDIAVNTTAANWALRGNGLCVSDSSSQLKKYLVTAGQYVYIKASKDNAGVFQWQTAASVPSYGTNAGLVGTPVNVATDGFFQVPTGATYLIVSSLKTNSTNNVMTAIVVSLDGIGTINQLTPTANVSGKVTIYGLWTSDSSMRIKKYSVTEGELLYLDLVKDSDVVYQFQDNASIPSSNPAHLVQPPVLSATKGSVFVPKGATYLMVVESTSNTTNVVARTDRNSDIVNMFQELNASTKCVNNFDSSLITYSVNFTARGFYIDKNLSLASSSNWVMSDPVLVRKGQMLSFIGTDTGTQTYFFVGVDSSVPLSAITDVRNFTRIVGVSAGDNTIDQTTTWIAPQDMYVIVQCFRYRFLELGTPPVVVELSELWGKVAELQNNTETLPLYVVSERERVYNILVERSSADVHIVAFSTDQHFDLDRLNMPESTYNPIWVMQGVQAMIDIANRQPIDEIVLGGDVAGYGGVTSADEYGILKTINYLLNPFHDVDTIVASIPGNHDAYQNNANVTAQGMYNVNAKRNQRHLYYHGNGTDNCDGYVDDTEHKIRTIYIDTYSQNTRTEDFRVFLESALSSLPNGYMALIFSHNPLTDEFAGTILAQKISDPSVTIDAFQNPSDCHIILNQYAAKIIACINGHTHFDAYGVSAAGILYIETTTAAPHTRNYTTENIPNASTIGTVTDTSYDFFVIDQSAQTIEAVRYGCGCNRKWVYKGANIGQMAGYPQAIER